MWLLAGGLGSLSLQRLLEGACDMATQVCCESMARGEASLVLEVYTTNKP